MFLLLVGCLAAPSPYRQEKRAARQLEPVELKQRAFGAANRTLRVRVYVDEGYQHRVHWRQHVAEVITRVNGYLRPSFGVTLDAEIRPWPRSANQEELTDVLEALAALDDGHDVDHVIGLTGALAVVSMAHHQLGLAAVPGKHFVLRAMNGAEELKLLERYYPSLPQSERVELLERRNAHKEVVLFVHEWAHNYGATHDDERTSMLASTYDNTADDLSPENGQLIARALSGAPPPTEPVAEAEPEPPADDRVALAEAEAKGARGDTKGALAALDQIALGLPDDATARWRDLGQAYDRLGAFARAEVALTRGQDPFAQSRALLRRREHGIHGVAAEREPDATRAVAAAHQALVEERYDEARRLADAGLRRFPDLPGLLALRCGADLYQGRGKAGERHCTRALEAWEETLFAHVFLGEIQRETRRPALAIPHLERALVLDPDLRSVYPSLAALYEATGDAAKLRALRSAHLARFGRSID